VSVTFTQNSGYFLAGASTAFSLPEGDWCIGCWVRIDTEPVALQYMYSVGLGGAGSFYLYNDSSANGFRFQIRDDGGTTAAAMTSTGMSLGVWRFIVIQSEESNNRIRLYMCLEDGTLSVESEISDPSNLLNAVNPSTSLQIGRRDDGAAGRTLSGGFISDFFVGNFALTTDQIEAIGRGLSPLAFINKGLKLYLPLNKNDTQKDWVSGVTFTQNGTITQGEQPNRYTSSANNAAVAGTSIVEGASVPPLYYNIDRKRRV
jgi:hypothetical protein